MTNLLGLVSIRGLNKKHLLNMMVNRLEIAYPTLSEIEIDKQKEELVQLKYIEYHKGVVIKIDFRNDVVDSFLYNRGTNANRLEQIVAVLRNHEEIQQLKNKKQRILN